MCVCVCEVCLHFPALAVVSTQPSHKHSVRENHTCLTSDLKAATVNNDGMFPSPFIHFIYLKWGLEFVPWVDNAQQRTLKRKSAMEQNPLPMRKGLCRVCHMARSSVRVFPPQTRALQPGQALRSRSPTDIWGQHPERPWVRTAWPSCPRVPEPETGRIKAALGNTNNES